MVEPEIIMPYPIAIKESAALNALRRANKRVDALLVVAVAARHVLTNASQFNLDYLSMTLSALPDDLRAIIMPPEVLDWQI